MSPSCQGFSKKTPIFSMNSISHMRFISICLQWDQGAKSIFQKDKKYQKYQRFPSSEATWMHAMTCDTWRIDPSPSEATCMYAMTCDTCHRVTFHRLPDEGNNRRNGDALEFQMSSSCSIVALITEPNWFCFNKLCLFSLLLFLASFCASVLRVIVMNMVLVESPWDKSGCNLPQCGNVEVWQCGSVVVTFP